MKKILGLTGRCKLRLGVWRLEDLGRSLAVVYSNHTLVYFDYCFKEAPTDPHESYTNTTKIKLGETIFSTQHE